MCGAECCVGCNEGLKIRCFLTVRYVYFRGLLGFITLEDRSVFARGPEHGVEREVDLVKGDVAHVSTTA